MLNKNNTSCWVYIWGGYPQMYTYTHFTIDKRKERWQRKVKESWILFNTLKFFLSLRLSLKELIEFSSLYFFSSYLLSELPFSFLQHIFLTGLSWWLRQNLPGMQETWVWFLRKILWRREWLPTAVFLSGESHGQRSLVGYSPWGHKESEMTEVT